MAPIQQQQQQAGYGGMQEQPMQTGQGYEMQNVGNGNGAPALGPGSSLQAFFQEVRPSFPKHCKEHYHHKYTDISYNYVV